VVGASLSEIWAEESSGYLAQLATRRDWRGRGLGRALLLATFADQRRRGLATGALDVNALNEGGLRLYESVGMRVAWRTDRWEKTVRIPEG
jgi:ribosomal protein S18 acetylase RimI-like enzyme